MNRYVIYARKSSESEERQILSIDSQLNELKKIAEKQQSKIVTVLTESKSAKSPGRPVFNELIELIKKGNVNSILVWNPDRLSRNSVDAGMLIYLFDIGVLQEIVTPYQVFKNTPNDKFLLNILWGQAKLENDNKGVNVKRGMKTKAEMGWYPYPALNGYLNTPERAKGYKILLKDLNTFPLLRKAWDLMLTGIYTVPQVHKIMNDEWGYRDRRGKPISRSCLYETFSHPFYYGYFKYDGIWYKGKHEPMVTKEEWDKVQKLIHRNNVPHPWVNDFLYVGMLKCDVCGFSVVGEQKIKFYPRTKRKAVYTYYHCSHKNKAVDCKQNPITEKKLEEELIKILESVEIDQDFKDWAMKYYHELDEHDQKNEVDINQSLKKSLGTVDAKLDSLLDLLLTHSITKEQYDEKRQKLLDEQRTLSNKLENKNNETSLLEKVEDIYSNALSIRARFDKEKKDGKRLLIRSIGSDYFLKDGVVRPNLLEPYYIFKDVKENPQKYFKKLELVDYPYLSPQTYDLAKANPTWLPRVDSDHKPCP